MEPNMNAEADKGSPEKTEHHKKEYHYFVDGKEYKTEDSALTGAQIKARIPDFNPSYQLVLEGRGGQPDKVIGDNDSVDLNVHPPCHFYTVPPATFGQ
jgi:hypothetical protein